MPALAYRLGMKRRSLQVLGLLAAMAVMEGCGADLGGLRTRAAFDMECSQNQLRLTELNSGNAMRNGEGAVYGVTGCGKRGTYVQTVQGAWLLNSEQKKRSESE